jgi:hypothetical protein
VSTERDATEAVRRQRFALQVAAELDRLRADRSLWVDYLADAEATAGFDGIG